MYQYTLLDNNLSRIPQCWFEGQSKRYKKKNPTLQFCFGEEVQALQNYHNEGEKSLDQAARAITRPISTTSIPIVGDEPDDNTALYQLWNLLISALVEWPTRFVPSLVSLLVAISKVPDPFHRGETLGNEEPTTWANLPLMNMCWYDNHWMSAGHMVEGASNDSRKARCAVYTKIHDAEAQLIAAGFLHQSRMVSYIVSVLERDCSSHADDPRWVSTRIYPDFHVPAIYSWIKYNGKKLYQCVGNDKLEELDKSQLSQHIKNPKDRWGYWKKRLLELGTEACDELVLKQAQETIKSMEYVESSLEDQGPN